MYNAKYSNRFRKDFEKAIKLNYNMELIKPVMHRLENGESLEAKYNDHPLKGEYFNCRECYIEPDWLLIYKVISENIYFIRTGTHSDLF